MDKTEFVKGCWYKHKDKTFDKNKYYCYTGNPSIFLYVNVLSRDVLMVTKSRVEELQLVEVPITHSHIKSLLAYAQRKQLLSTIKRINECLEKIEYENKY